MLVEIRVSPNDAGQRAERFLRRWFPLLSTGRLQSLFRRKEIKVLKKPVDTTYLLQAGEVLQVFGIREEEAVREVDAESTDAARISRTRKSAIDYPPPSIVFEDHELMVVNKPSGMAAHPGSGILPGASLIERVRTYLAKPKAEKKAEKNAKRDQEKRNEREEKSGLKPEPKSGLKSDRAREEWNAERGDVGEPDLESLLFGGSSEGLTPGWGTELFRPALVHRLDKETSGVLLIAKSGPMLRTLTEALREGKIRKRYLALVAGHPVPASGTIDAALARVDSASGAKSLIAEDDEGKASVTRYKTIKTMGTAKDGHALLQVVIETGRMHQIRAHLAHIGHPIAGDTRYGALRPAEVRERMKALGLTRLFLHAEELSWKDGTNKRTFQAPLPEELGKVVGRN
jgi:23S rRNA-/tRNA-specific pseudouridylate synthase